MVYTLDTLDTLEANAYAVALDASAVALDASAVASTASAASAAASTASAVACYVYSYHMIFVVVLRDNIEAVPGVVYDTVAQVFQAQMVVLPKMFVVLI